MVTEILLCRHCRSQNVIKHGRDKRGVQRFRCHDCGRTFQKPEDDRSYTPAFRAQVLAAYQERASMRGVSRVFAISRITLGDWLKKARTLPPLAQTLMPAQPDDVLEDDVLEDDVLELDEVWSFVLRRKDKKWVWLALCRRTRQIVAFAVGDRSHKTCNQKTCERRWQRVPPSCRRLLCYTDFWGAYGKVIPDEQHEAADKGEGQTCHITPIKPRAVQQHAAAAAGPVRAPDALVQQERQDAQGLPSLVPPRLQPSTQHQQH